VTNLIHPPTAEIKPDHIPDVLAVIDIGRTQYIVLCPFCGKKHLHGAGGGLGLRISHCRDRAVGDYNLVAALTEPT
jgi:hypothetical protein